VEQIAPESRAFLVCLFTDLRTDLAGRADAGGPAGPDPESVARNIAVFDALLIGLGGNGQLPDDEHVRQYVVELAKATDENNEYERVDREHRAFAELAGALARR